MLIYSEKTSNVIARINKFSMLFLLPLIIWFHYDIESIHGPIKLFFRFFCYFGYAMIIFISFSREVKREGDKYYSLGFLGWKELNMEDFRVLITLFFDNIAIVKYTNRRSIKYGVLIIQPYRPYTISVMINDLENKRRTEERIGEEE